LNTLSDTDLLNESNQNAIAAKEDSIKFQELNISKQELNILNTSKTYDELLRSQRIALISKENDVENKKKALEVAEISYNDLVK
jgi:hypothetical protein